MYKRIMLEMSDLKVEKMSYIKRCNDFSFNFYDLGKLTDCVSCAYRLAINVHLFKKSEDITKIIPFCFRPFYPLRCLFWDARK